MGQVPYGVTELTLPSSWCTHSWTWLNVMKIWALERSGVASLRWLVRRPRTAWRFLVDHIIPWVARPSPGLCPGGFTCPGQMHRHLRFSSFNTLTLERAWWTSGSLIRLRKERLGSAGGFSRATQRGAVAPVLWSQRFCTLCAGAFYMFALEFQVLNFFMGEKCMYVLLQNESKSIFLLLVLLLIHYPDLREAQEYSSWRLLSLAVVRSKWPNI